MNPSAHLSDQDMTSDQRVLAELRRMIMDGSLAAGEKISEVSISNLFDVSRTPAKLALRTLEVEGLIVKRDGRGFTILKLDLSDLSKAYEVRGILEGLAAATLAKAGVSSQTEDALQAAIDEMDTILTADITIGEMVEGYQDANRVFHETIMQSNGNEFIGFAFTRMESLPLVALGTVVINADKSHDELMRLRFGNMQHRLIFDALRNGDPQRAEALMREHANQIPIYTKVFA